MTYTHARSRSSSRKHALLWTIAIAAALVLQPAAVFAHQSPGGCNGNRLNASIIKDRTEVYQGQTITYSITVNNVDFGGDIACDITSATVELTLPAPDGSATGQLVILATGVDYLAGTSTLIVGSAQYVVAVNPGVTDIVAQASVAGTLHDAPVDHSAQIVKTIGTSVVTPPSTPDAGMGEGESSNTPLLPNTGTAPR